MAAATPETPTSALDTSDIPDQTDTMDGHSMYDASGNGVVPSSAEPFPAPLEETTTDEVADPGSSGESVTEATQATESESVDAQDPDGEAKAGTEKDEYVDLRVPNMSAEDDTRLAEFKKVPAIAGLSSEQAQKFINEDVKRVEARARQHGDAVEARNNEWQDASKKDPEIGGVDFEKNLHEAKTFLKSYNDDVLVDMLNQSGLGNHPSFVRLFVRLAKANGEDSTFVITQPGKGERTLEERLVPELA